MKDKNLLWGPYGAPNLPYEESNIKVIEKFGRLPGKNIVVLGGVHGNEVCGVRVIGKLAPNLEINAGKVTFIIANLEAIKQNKRFMEYNLNRCFLKKQPKEIFKSFEGRLAREIMPYLDRADLMLDIHASFTPKSIPFVICQPQSFGFAMQLPPKIISWNWDEFQPGSTDYYMNLQNKIGICVECGYLKDSESELRAKTALIDFLALAGAIKNRTTRLKKKRFLKIIFQYKNKYGKFTKSRDFSDFEILKERILIGKDGNKKVYGRRGDVLLFVRDREELGEECFLTAKETLLNSKKLN
jgi:succinylglutamate desuccinylase